MCVLQFVLEVVAVVFRQKLAGNDLYKSVWIGAAGGLTVVMLILGVDHLKQFRQLVLFVFCLIQLSAMILLVVTLQQIRELGREKQNKIKVAEYAGKTEMSL